MVKVRPNSKFKVTKPKKTSWYVRDMNFHIKPNKIK